MISYFESVNSIYVCQQYVCTYVSNADTTATAHSARVPNKDQNYNSHNNNNLLLLFCFSSRNDPKTVNRNGS